MLKASQGHNLWANATIKQPRIEQQEHGEGGGCMLLAVISERSSISGIS
jgi:hypothetical protein